VRHYWRIYSTFFKSSLTRELQFRVNFFAKVLQNTVWFFFFLAMLYIIYAKVDQIGGWNKSESAILAATLFIVSSMNNLLTFSLMEIPQHVRQGTLDFIITKPVDSQFWVSARKFNFNELGSFFAGFILLFFSVKDLNPVPTASQYGIYFLGVVSAWMILYSFQLALMTTGIYFIKIDNLWVLGETLVGLSRNPMEIFPSVLRSLLTFAIPVAFLAYFPASQLVRGSNWSSAGIGFAYAVAFLIASRLWWRYSLKHYSSASS
jgi:ABC-2 type transport system permease protein